MKYSLSLLLLVLTAGAAGAAPVNGGRQSTLEFDMKEDERLYGSRDDKNDWTIESATDTKRPVYSVPAHRHVERSIVRDIGNGEIQIEYISGKHSEVVIMSREQASELLNQLCAVFGATVYYPVGPNNYKHAKPAAR